MNRLSDIVQDTTSVISSFDDLLYQLRREAIDSLAREWTEDVHAHHRFFYVAKKLCNFGVLISRVDTHRGGISDAFIKDEVEKAIHGLMEPAIVSMAEYLFHFGSDDALAHYFDIDGSCRAINPLSIIDIYNACPVDRQVHLLPIMLSGYTSEYLEVAIDRPIWEALEHSEAYVKEVLDGVSRLPEGIRSRGIIGLLSVRLSGRQTIFQLALQSGWDIVLAKMRGAEGLVEIIKALGGKEIKDAPLEKLLAAEQLAKIRDGHMLARVIHALGGEEIKDAPLEKLLAAFGPLGIHERDDFDAVVDSLGGWGNVSFPRKNKILLLAADYVHRDIYRKNTLCPCLPATRRKEEQRIFKSSTPFTELLYRAKRLNGASRKSLKALGLYNY